LGFLIGAAGIEIAGERVNLVPRMFLPRFELIQNGCGFVVGWRMVGARKITQIEHDVPIKRRAAIAAAVFALLHGFGKAAPAMLQVAMDMRAGCNPNIECSVINRHLTALMLWPLGLLNNARCVFGRASCQVSLAVAVAVAPLSIYRP